MRSAGLSRDVQNRTGLLLRRVLRSLKPLRTATVEINGVITTSIPAALSPDEDILLKRWRPDTKAPSRK